MLGNYLGEHRVTGETRTAERKDTITHAAAVLGRHRNEVGFVRRNSLETAAGTGSLFVTEHGAAYIRHRTKLLPWSTTLYAIISEQSGEGQLLLAAIYDAMRAERKTLLRAKCPTTLPANAWYRRRGFVLYDVEHPAGKRSVNVWHKEL